MWGSGRWGLVGGGEGSGRGSGRGIKSGGCQGGCVQRIEVIVKMPKKLVGVRSVGGGGGGSGRGRGGGSGWMCTKN